MHAGARPPRSSRRHWGSGCGTPAAAAAGVAAGQGQCVAKTPRLGGLAELPTFCEKPWQFLRQGGGGCMIAQLVSKQTNVLCKGLWTPKKPAQKLKKTNTTFVQLCRRERGSAHWTRQFPMTPYVWRRFHRWRVRLRSTKPSNTSPTVPRADGEGPGGDRD